MYTKILLATMLAVLAPVQAQVLREDFKEVDAHIPVNQTDLTSPFLTLLRLGPGAEKLKLSYHPEIKNDPHYVWNGMCSGPTLLAFQFQKTLDLTHKNSHVRLRTKNFGKSSLHLAIQSGGQWYVQKKGIKKQKDWTISKQALHGKNNTFHQLNVATCQIGKPARIIDFKNVTGLGFLSPKKPDSSNDCTRLDWFELHSDSAAATVKKINP